MTASRRSAPWRRVATASLIALACAALSLPRAHGANESCELTIDQKAAAVKAFKALSPIFHDARCMNCHGAVNPFARNGRHGGGYIDIRAEAREFLGRPDLASALNVGPNPTAQDRAREIQRIRGIAESRTEITDNDVVRARAFDVMREVCSECHVSGWTIPMSHNYFVGRDWKWLCRHMKTSSDTNTPVRFLRHIQNDPLMLIPEAFKGQRGLTESPPAPDPPAMPFDTMVRHANDWIAAMDGRYHPPPECGCEVEGLLMEVRHRMYADPESGSSKAGYAQFDGTVEFVVLLTQLEGTPEAWYVGETTVTRPLEVRHVRPAFIKCAGAGSRTEDWRVSARVLPDGRAMRVTFNFMPDDEEAAWTCTGPGYSSTEPLYVDLGGDLTTVEMPVTDGAVGEATGRGPKFIESITLTVIESPVAPPPEGPSGR